MSFSTELAAAGLGTSIDGLLIGASMYANDLALIADSPEALQGMLDIVSSYARRPGHALVIGTSHLHDGGIEREASRLLLETSQMLSENATKL